MDQIMNNISSFVKEYGGLGWVIATLALLFAIFQFAYKRRSHKASLKVGFSNGVLTYPNGSLSEAMIFLKISNTGNKKVVLSSVRLDIKSQPNSSVIDGYGNLASMPYVLEPSCDYQVWYEIKPIAKNLKKNGQSGRITIHGEFSTQANGKFKSKKPYKLDVDGWSK
jgi:hypothetical protein